MSDEQSYIDFVTGLYGCEPNRVAGVYRMLYPDSHCWALAEEDAVAELAWQDAQDGRDAWAFRDDHELTETKED